MSRPKTFSVTRLLAGFLAFGVLSGLATRAESGSTGPTLEVQLPGGTKKLTLSELKTKLKEVTVTTDTPVYHKKKSYDGFLLTDVLRLAGLESSGTPAIHDEIVFTALDGYSPNTSFLMVQNHHPVIAFREHGQKGFENVEQGKATVSPAPFMVVWEEGATLGESVPWAYQLAKIEIVDFKQKYSKLYPKTAAADSGVMKGFHLFKNQCLRCHSINLQGGELGPELNAPKNITEYWSKENLRKFIRNATSFRYKSKMPPFPHLKDEEIEQILDYLEHMKGFKSN